MLTPEELAAAPDAIRSAAVRFTVTRIESPADDGFEAAFAALHAEFAHKGELERRAVIERWLDREPRYFLLAAWDDKGQLAAVRACHLRHDDDVCVVFLAHMLVMPPFRRSGVASLFRHIPEVLGQRMAGGKDVVLVAEMESFDPDDPATTVRFTSYGRAGFVAVDPADCVYYQADFRAGPQDAPQPVPLVLVVKWLGREEARVAPGTLVEAVVRALYDVFGSHCPEAHIDLLQQEVLGRLAGRADFQLLEMVPAMFSRLTHAGGRAR